ncbi:MAG: hypothetical protein Q7R52_05185 [archaeon]|nr:hypothetical protein [archaeon]
METRLEIKVDGIEAGIIKISGTNNRLKVSGNVLPDGDYSYTIGEIKTMIENKMKRNYPGKNVEIAEYPINVEFVASVGDCPGINFIRRDQD